MWPGNQADSYAPTGFFGTLCNTMSSCVGLLCCCWLFRDCLGHRREPSTPLMAPPPGPVDDRRQGSHGQFGPGPPGPIDDRLAHLGGPHSPFGPGHTGPRDDRLAHLGGPHSPFGVSNPPGHSPFGMCNPPGPMDDRLGHLGGPHSPFGTPDAPDPPELHRPPIQRYPHEPPPMQPSYPNRPPPIQYGYPGQQGPPEPPRVPGVQPGLL
ncbi:uncharacterized protein LOC143565525 isoform X1 [Bidens hawaiensis]|uniref:uncharacterized protein LOC143565525 isoform X1 n=1 Tax=Bidens hawaiensis TaxID=980011 RepID=UPI00404AA7AF